ncbi:MAG: hypothetical protein P8X58_08420 [Syntrophobacterales bacterium]
MPRKEKVLWLDDNCIFVALRETASEEPRMIILNHATGQHFKPEHESAQEVLNLLVKKTERDPGIHYKDLRKSMLNLFDLDENNVDGALITFLDKLDGLNILLSETGGPGSGCRGVALPPSLKEIPEAWQHPREAGVIYERSFHRAHKCLQSQLPPLHP